MQMIHADMMTSNDTNFCLCVIVIRTNWMTITHKHMYVWMYVLTDVTIITYRSKAAQNVSYFVIPDNFPHVQLLVKTNLLK